MQDTLLYLEISRTHRDSFATDQKKNVSKLKEEKHRRDLFFVLLFVLLFELLFVFSLLT